MPKERAQIVLKSSRSLCQLGLNFREQLEREISRSRFIKTFAPVAEDLYVLRFIS
jgi:hypothetical protein